MPGITNLSTKFFMLSKVYTAEGGNLKEFCHCLWGWSGGAMVLGKLPVLGRPTNLDSSSFH